MIISYIMLWDITLNLFTPGEGPKLAILQGAPLGVSLSLS